MTGPSSSITQTPTLALSGGLASIPSVFVAPGTTEVAIQSAINALAGGGGGTVYLGAGIYTINNPVTLASGVEVVGTPPAWTLGNTSFMGQQWSPVGGTQITAGSATQGFIANATAGGSDSATWGTSYLTNIKLRNLCFIGFSGGGVQIGAPHVMGVQASFFDNLYFYQCGSFGADWTTGLPCFLLKNFSAIEVSNIYVTACQCGPQFLLSNTTEQTGNSKFRDLIMDTFGVPAGAGIYATNPGTWCRGIVFGTDPLISSGASALNEIKAEHIQVQGVQRATFSDAAASFNATSTISVTHLEYFPIGIPVYVTTGAGGNVPAGQLYFVLSRSGSSGSGTITMGNYRNTTAFTPNYSGTVTLNNAGWPLLELCGLGTVNGNVADSSFTGLDLEGGYPCALYMEGAGVWIGLNQTSGNTGICARVGQSSIVNSVANYCDIDIDGSTANTFLFFGTRNRSVQGGPAQGLWFDGSSSGGNAAAYTGAGAYGLTLSGSGGNYQTFGNNKHPDLFLGGNGSSLGAFLRPGMALGTQTGSFNAGGSLKINGTFGGYRSLEQATPQTYTLEAPSNSNLGVSNVGVTLECVCIGAGTATVKPTANSAGQFINDNSGLTNNQVVLTTGQWAKFICAYSAANNHTYWACLTNGTIS